MGGSYKFRIHQMIHVFQFMDPGRNEQVEKDRRWAQMECHIFGSLVLRAMVVTVAKAHGSLVLTFSQRKNEEW